MTALAQRRSQQVSPKHDWVISEVSMLCIHTSRSSQRHWPSLLQLNSTNFTSNYHHHLHHLHRLHPHDCIMIVYLLLLYTQL